MKKRLLTIYSLFFSVYGFSQQEVEMAAELQSSGKIYVVVAVLVVIFISIVIYLISIDRKISKMERDK